MVAWEVEPKKKKQVKVPFGEQVHLPVAFINYRAIEESLKGIESEIFQETSYARRQKLYKIRKQIKKILTEL